VRAASRKLLAGAGGILGASLLLGCAAFDLQHDCYGEVAVRYRREGTVRFDDGVGDRASGPFLLDEESPSQDESPPGLTLDVEGEAHESSSATFTLNASLSGSAVNVMMVVAIPAPGTYSLESLAAVMRLLTSSSSAADAGVTEQEVNVRGSVTVMSAAATGCTEAFNAASEIVEVCARTLVLDLTLLPSPQYPVSGTFSISLLTKLVVTGTTTSLSCVD